MSKAVAEGRQSFGAQLAELAARLKLPLLPRGKNDAATKKTARRELAYILRNIATLVENGVSLPRALATVAQERSLRSHAGMLEGVRRRVESGESFSSALRAYPATFDELIVHQIRVGERSGTISESLDRIAERLEQANDLRARIIKRLSYPAVVSIAGTGVVIFMLTYVVPQFEATYRHARIPLPAITQLLMAIGQFTLHYGWIVLLGSFAALIALHRARKNPAFAYRFDLLLLRVPLLGTWLRDVAVLQFMDVLGIMMMSGFKLVDALAVSVGSVKNQAVSRAVDGLRSAVVRGERLSRELEKHGEMFPPVVSQLVIIGEQTGNLAKSSADVRSHLRRQIEVRADVLVGMLEPVLTIVMAAAIGVILLAIYLPMFSMVDAVDAVHPK